MPHDPRPECLVITRCRQLGWAMPPAVWQRLGFRLCLMIAARGVARQGDAYRVSSIACFPRAAAGEAWVDALIQEVLCAIS